MDVDGRKVNIVDFCKQAPPVDLDEQFPEAKSVAKADLDATLYKASPSMFRNAPVRFVLSVLLIAACGFGLLILLIWFLRCWGLKLIVDGRKTTLRKGILSKSITEVRHKDVRNVQISQSFLQRIFGVGKVGISSSGQGGLEIEIAGLPTPAKIKAIIDEHRE